MQFCNYCYMNQTTYTFGVLVFKKRVTDSDGRPGNECGLEIEESEAQVFKAESTKINNKNRIKNI